MTAAKGTPFVSPAASKTLTYFGGPVLTNTYVVPAYWNSSVSYQSNLNGLFSAGKLPAPTAHAYYPVHFNAGVSVSDTGGAKSCVTWCAHHGTYTRNGVNVNYGIIPDQGGSCSGGCGSNAQRFNNLTSVASHELVEATTDPAVGLATTYAPPLVWYNKTYGEIGDICNAQQATITVGAASYVVQTEWSNASNACKVVR